MLKFNLLFQKNTIFRNTAQVIYHCFYLLQLNNAVCSHENEKKSV